MTYDWSDRIEWRDSMDLGREQTIGVSDEPHLGTMRCGAIADKAVRTLVE